MSDQNPDSTPDFNSLLDRNADEFERPKPLPIGTYTFALGDYKMDKSQKKGTPYVEFEAKVMQAMPDVDATQLNEVPNYSQRKLRLTFYLTEDAAYRLTEFAEKTLGLSVNRPMRQLLAEMKGLFFQGYVTQRPSEKPGDTSIYNDISSTRPM